MAKFKIQKAFFTQICLQQDWKQGLEAVFAEKKPPCADTAEINQALPTAKEAVNALLALLPRPELRWQAAYGLGLAVSRLATQEREEARVIMRRLMWSLNEESGNIGWGIPEAMGCILAHSPAMAKEYARIFLSYGYETGKDDNYLDFAALRAGVYWGVGYLALHSRDEALPALGQLGRELLDDNAEVAGMAAFALASLAKGAKPETEAGQTALWQVALNNAAQARDALGPEKNMPEMSFFDGEALRSSTLAELLEKAGHYAAKLVG